MSKSIFERWHKSYDDSCLHKSDCKMTWLAALRWALRHNDKYPRFYLNDDKIRAEIKKCEAEK